MRTKPLLAIVLLITATLSTTAPAREVRLTKKQIAAVNEQVVRAYELGDPVALLRAISPLVARFTPDHVIATDRLLAEQGVPPLGQLLSETRLMFVEQGLVEELPAPQRFELLLTLEALAAQVDDALAEQNRHAIMSDPLAVPATMTAYEQLFWEVHVLDNRLSSARRAAQYAKTLAKSAQRLNRKSLNEKQVALIDRDFSALTTEIDRRQQSLSEREMEMRLYRLEDSLAVLSDAKNPTRDRLQAAFAFAMDGQLLDEFFQQRAKNPRPLLRPDLADAELPALVQQQVEKGEAVAGDLIEKAKLLNVGLHWWMRGRYGAGPEAFGLLKSREATQSDEAMFPLYMPVTTPKPTNPAKLGQPQVPAVDRRHHYAWMAEYRPFGVVNTETTSKEASRRITSITHLSKFY